jgi:hypothetical protein
MARRTCDETSKKGSPVAARSSACCMRTGSVARRGGTRREARGTSQNQGVAGIATVTFFWSVIGAKRVSWPLNSIAPTAIARTPLTAPPARACPRTPAPFAALPLAGASANSGPEVALFHELPHQTAIISRSSADSQERLRRTHVGDANKLLALLTKTHRRSF